MWDRFVGSISRQSFRSVSDTWICRLVLLLNYGLLSLIASACNGELLRGVERRVLECTGYAISLAEKPLFGMQDAPIPELAPLIGVDPLPSEKPHAQDLTVGLVLEVNVPFSITWYC